MTYIIISAIVLVLLIGLEVWTGYRRNFKTYTLSDSIVNLSCGMIERLFDYFWVVLLFFAFEFVFENIALWHIPVNVFTWILALLFTDLLAYWFHRLSHEINFLWAAHIVHHQSEELNITTVFRVSFFAVIFRSFFFIWLPVLGFDPYVATSTIVFVGAFQFVTHSRQVGKLGILEYIFTTPSHHRVHHARNEKYLDRNYSHVFIIWDKIFGSFRVEEEEPKYGITSGFESVNPYRAQFAYWKNLIVRARQSRSLKNKIKLFLQKPTWTPEDSPFLPPEYKVDKTGERIDFKYQIKPEFGLYLLFSVISTFLAFIAVILVKFQINQPDLSDLFNHYPIVLLSVFILYSIFVHTRLMEGTKVGFWAELSRLIVYPILCIFLFGNDSFQWLSISIILFSVVLIPWLLRLKMIQKIEEQEQIAVEIFR